jgi:hypothetical protein
MPRSVPRSARESTSRNHASGVRFVKYPSGGRRRSVHTFPIVRWTWRPSGSRYFARHTGRRFPSTRKTCPEIARSGRVDRH